MADNVTVSNSPLDNYRVRSTQLGSGDHLQHVHLVDDGDRALRVDEASASLNTITFEHHEIHEGDSFTASYTADLGNGANADILITTPNTTRWMHLIHEITVESESHVTIYENPTISNVGTPITAYNRNRNSSEAATGSITHTPTVGATGTTIIREAHFGSGRGTGGSDRGTSEFILKQNEQYLLRINNQTTSNNYISVKLDWYEHTNVS